MPELHIAERFRRGGWRGAIRAARRRLAEVIAPDDRSEPTDAAEPAAAPKPDVQPDRSKLSAIEVSHDAALEWFESRHANYVALAGSLRGRLPEEGVLLDVGANIGYFTKVVGDELGFTGTAHLFEPIPHLAELCSSTLDDTDFSSAVHPFGLSGEDATVDIFVADDGNLGWNTMVAGRRTSGMAAISIDVRRFDDLALDVVPDVIKIDVEGAEHRVLSGMQRSLETWTPKPTILCEIGWGTNHPDWEAELAAFAMLEKIGYSAHDLEGEPLDVASLSKTTDVLFLPHAPVA
ncbi:FkbM family methyltransferase [Ilumatobacter sp.]|uniref:FkbM family methyltransferase n=1 Tax=Ilumatobacter sp. TaxID=1967498 RepID=UPI003C40DEF5